MNIITDFKKELSKKEFGQAIAKVRKKNKDKYENLIELKKCLAEWFGGECYIRGATAIEVFDILIQEFDYGFQEGLAAKVKIIKQEKATLGRLFLYMDKKIRSLQVYEKRYTDSQEEMRRLLKGETEIVACPDCAGDEDDCVYCGGIGKIIGEIEE